MSAAKSAYALTDNVQGLIDHFGIENCGFLTLTFADDVRDTREASARFNSFRTNWLSKRMKAYAGVYERTKRGVIHFHFIVALNGNILWELRNGKVVTFDFKEVRNKNTPRRLRYRSANAYLRQLWTELRESLPKYGFGSIHNLVPVSNGKGAGNYLAKYLKKGMETRQASDKGFRLVRSTSGKAAWVWRRSSTVFAWLGGDSAEWRKALCSYILERANIARYRLAKEQVKQFPTAFLQELQKISSMTAENYSEIMRELYGCAWCYRQKEKILEEWQKNKGRPEREIYFYEMGIGGYVRILYEPETGGITRIL